MSTWTRAPVRLRYLGGLDSIARLLYQLLKPPHRVVSFVFDVRSIGYILPGQSRRNQAASMTIQEHPTTIRFCLKSSLRRNEFWFEGKLSARGMGINNGT